MVLVDTGRVHCISYGEVILGNLSTSFSVNNNYVYMFMFHHGLPYANTKIMSVRGEGDGG